ncbi:hypothetical protein H8E88_00280, partial [candidate division KSB1 bacterium]|nr:hypothetical protein [candidate division KSB1 bacterium]
MQKILFILIFLLLATFINTNAQSIISVANTEGSERAPIIVSYDENGEQIIFVVYELNSRIAISKSIDGGQNWSFYGEIISRNGKLPSATIEDGFLYVSFISTDNHSIYCYKYDIFKSFNENELSYENQMSLGLNIVYRQSILVKDGDIYLGYARTITFNSTVIRNFCISKNFYELDEKFIFEHPQKTFLRIDGADKEGGVYFTYNTAFIDGYDQISVVGDESNDNWQQKYFSSTQTNKGGPSISASYKNDWAICYQDENSVKCYYKLKNGTTKEETITINGNVSSIDMDVTGEYIYITQRTKVQAKAEAKAKEKKEY